MMLKCPNDDGGGRHEYFSVIAHVTQEWAMDRNGEFVGVRINCIDVTHRPDYLDRFMCEECGEDALVYDSMGKLIRG